MFEKIDLLLDNLLQSIGLFGPLLACFLIIIESIIPILPLFVFITFNFYKFGSLIGFFISWICTCLGCFLSFLIFRKNIRIWWYGKLKEKGLLSIKTMNRISSLKFEQLTMIIAIPFTPAFLINIACGLSKMTFKKYFFAIVIGKVFIVYFWGIVGVSFIESIKHPEYLIRVLLLLIIAYVIGKIANKKLNIND